MRQDINQERIVSVYNCSLSFAMATQLPVYVPNEEEQKDPDKYSKNVRKYMVRPPASACALFTRHPRKPHAWLSSLACGCSTVGDRGCITVGVA